PRSDRAPLDSHERRHRFRGGSAGSFPRRLSSCSRIAKRGHGQERQVENRAAFVPERRDGRGPFCVRYLRSDLKPARTSSEKSCGCSHAAKWPPLSSLLWCTSLGYACSAQLCGTGCMSSVTTCTPT